MLLFAALAALALVSVSCAKTKAEQMAMAQNIDIRCTPEVLECVAGEIPVSISVTYPKGYMQPLATIDVTPVLVYEGGEIAGETYRYQGEKVKDNYKVIPVAGGTVTEQLRFPFRDGCQRSHLELRSHVYYKGHQYEVPVVKVADGCLVTYALADLGGLYARKDDGYQAVIRQEAEGRILYDVNSATVKGSELRSGSISDMQQELRDWEADSRVRVKGTRIEAYASPEGGQDYNARLSDKRAASARQAWKKIADDKDAPDVAVKSLGQDWEGFQEAVAQSDIRDRELILRVLSMYSDPAVRESEIRNLSQVYTEINKKVFPELRRARFVTEGEWQNYTDAELREMAQRGLAGLDEPSLLHLAATATDAGEQEVYLKAAVNQYDSDVARYNLACLYLDMGKVSLAGAYLGKIKQPDADVMNAVGVVAMRNEDFGQAARCFRNAEKAEAAENLALLDILQGNYAAAARKLDGCRGDNAAIAHLLVGDLRKAETALSGTGARAEYIRAIIAARKGDTAGVKKYLASVQEKDAALAQRAQNDIEFSAFEI